MKSLLLLLVLLGFLSLALGQEKAEKTVEEKKTENSAETQEDDDGDEEDDLAGIEKVEKLVRDGSLSAEEAKATKDMLKRIQRLLQERKEEEVDRTPYLTTLKLPFNESRIKELFHFPEDTIFPLEPLRLRNVTRAQFAEYASRGQPVIVEDGFDGWKAKDTWNCEWFKKEFPNEKVEGWTYGDDPADTTKAAAKKAQFRKYFRDLDVNVKHKITEEETPKGLEDDKNPDVMSWLWFPFRPDDLKAQKSPAALKIKEYYNEPYFLPNSKVNRVTVKTRFEAFFGSKNSGVQPHVDDICEFIFSAQASGQKRWRLSVPINMEELHALNPGYKEDPEDFKVLQPRMLLEKPLFDFVMTPGDQLFFPPGMVHGTKVVSDDCSMSLSLQFRDPAPVHYVRDWSAGLTSPCFHDYWNYWMFGQGELRSNGDPAQNKKECRRLFSEFDFERDGQLSVAEMREVLEMDRVYAEDLRNDDRFKNPQNDAENFVRLHDENNDGFVSKAEYMKVCVNKWTPRMKQSSLKFRRAQRLQEDFESLWQSLGPTRAKPYVDEATYRKRFPKCNFWSLVTGTLDQNQDGKIEEEELNEMIEAAQDSQWAPPIMIPIAMLLTCREDGLDVFLKGEEAITGIQKDEL